MFSVGSLPDMVHPTPNCTLVVALENEGVVVDGQFYDPPGGVGIIRFPSGIAAEPDVKILDFTKFDNEWVHGNYFGLNVKLVDNLSV